MMDHAAVRVRPTEVDLGVCRGVRFDRGADAWVILLPGANYPTTAPVLWFAREAALAAGRNVLAVVDSPKGSTDDRQRWAEERAEAALRHVGVGARPILVAKSITSLAASLAARLGLPAIWLTPLINAAGTPISQAVIDGLAEASAPFLLIGGSADPRQASPSRRTTRWSASTASTPRTRSATGSNSSRMPTPASPTADEQRQERGGARQTLGSVRTLTVVGRTRRQRSLRARCASSGSACASTRSRAGATLDRGAPGCRRETYPQGTLKIAATVAGLAVHSGSRKISRNSRTAGTGRLRRDRGQRLALRLWLLVAHGEAIASMIAAGDVRARRQPPDDLPAAVGVTFEPD